MRVVTDLLPLAIALAPLVGAVVAVVQKRRAILAIVRDLRAVDRGARDGELDF